MVLAEDTLEWWGDYWQRMCDTVLRLDPIHWRDRKERPWLDRLYVRTLLIPGRVSATLDTQDSQRVEPQLRYQASPVEKQHSLPRTTVTKSVELDLDLLQTGKRLLVWGDPGMGKTTVLSHLAMRAERDKRWLPLYIPLRYGADYIIRASDHSLSTLLTCYVEAVVRDRGGVDIGRALERGQLLLLLDGLDELDGADRNLWINALVQWATEWEARNTPAKEKDGEAQGENISVALSSPMVITSRFAGMPAASFPTNLFDHYSILPMGEEQSKELLRNWFTEHIFTRAAVGVPDKENHTESETNAPHDWGYRQARQMIRALKEQPGLHRVIENPLLLRIAASTYTGDRLPQRSHLYRLYIHDVLESRTALADGLGRMDYCLGKVAREDLACLQKLAWLAQTSPDPLTLAQALDALEAQRETQAPDQEQLRYQQLERLTRIGERSGLLEPLEEDRVKEIAIRFTHQTFQEYLVARELFDQWWQNPKKTLRNIRHWMDHTHWQEPILLWLGLLDREIAWPIVRGELFHRPDWGVRCLREGIGYEYEELRPSWQTETCRGLQRVGRLAWKRDVKTVIYLLARRILNPRQFEQDVGCCWEAIEALGTLQIAESIPYLDHVTVDAFNPLSEKQRHWSYKIASILGRMKTSDVVPFALSVLEDHRLPDEWRDWSGRILQNLRGDGAVERLTDLLRHAEARKWAILGLIRLAKDPRLRDQIREILENEAQSSDSVLDMRQALEQVGSPLALPAMMDKIRQGPRSAWTAGELYNALNLLELDEACNYARELILLKEVQEEPRDAITDPIDQAHVRIRCRTLLRLAVDPDPDVRQAARQLLPWVRREYVGNLPAEDEPFLLELMTDLNNADDPLLRRASSAANTAARLVALSPLTSAFCDELMRRVRDPQHPGHEASLVAAQHLWRAPAPYPQLASTSLAWRLALPDLDRGTRNTIYKVLAALKAYETLWLALYRLEPHPNMVGEQIRSLVKLCAPEGEMLLRQVVLPATAEPIDAILERAVVLRDVPEGYSQLLEMLRSDDPWTRRAALCALGSMATEETAQPLYDWLQRLSPEMDPLDLYYDTYAFGVATNRLMRWQVVDLIVAGLSDEGYGSSHRDLAMAAADLDRAGAAERTKLSEHLIGLLKNGSEALDGRPVIYALGQLRVADSIAAIINWYQRQQDATYDLIDRTLVGSALGRMPVDAILPVLEQLIEQGPTSSRLVALYALGELRDLAAVPVLFPWLDSREKKRAGEQTIDWDREATFAAVSLGKIALTHGLSQMARMLSLRTSRDRRLFKHIDVAASHAQPTLYLYEQAITEKDRRLQRRLALLLMGLEQDRHIVYVERLSKARGNILPRVVSGWHRYVDEWSYYGDYLKNVLRVDVDCLSTRGARSHG